MAMAQVTLSRFVKTANKGKSGGSLQPLAANASGCSSGAAKWFLKLGSPVQHRFPYRASQLALFK